MATRVRGSSRDSCKRLAKASFVQFQKGRSALFRCCLAPILSFTAMLFCCWGGCRFFPWRHELEAVAETHAKTLSVLFGTCFVLHCHAVLLFGKVRLSPMATRVRSSSRNSCKSFLSTVSERTFGTFSVLLGTRFVLHCHAVLLFGKLSFSHGDKS